MSDNQTPSSVPASPSSTPSVGVPSAPVPPPASTSSPASSANGGPQNKPATAATAPLPTPTPQPTTAPQEGDAAAVIPVAQNDLGARREVDGNIVTADAADQAASPGVLTAANLYGTGPAGAPIGTKNATVQLDWRLGVDHIRDTLAAEGFSLSQAAVEFVRRVAGELYQHQVGGPPASQAAQETADKLTGAPSQDVATYLNRQARYFEQVEGSHHLNNMGHT